MRRETQVELIRELLAHHAAGTTQLADDVLALPVEVYTSESHWQAERESPVPPPPGGGLSVRGGGLAR